MLGQERITLHKLLSRFVTEFERLEQMDNHATTQLVVESLQMKRGGQHDWQYLSYLRQQDDLLRPGYNTSWMNCSWLGGGRFPHNKEDTLPSPVFASECDEPNRNAAGMATQCCHDTFETKFGKRCQSLLVQGQWDPGVSPAWSRPRDGSHKSHFASGIVDSVGTDSNAVDAGCTVSRRDARGVVQSTLSTLVNMYTSPKHQVTIFGGAAIVTKQADMDATYLHTRDQRTGLVPCLAMKSGFNKYGVQCESRSELARLASMRTSEYRLLEQYEEWPLFRNSLWMESMKRNQRPDPSNDYNQAANELLGTRWYGHGWNNWHNEWNKSVCFDAGSKFDSFSMLHTPGIWAHPYPLPVKGAKTAGVAVSRIVGCKDELSTHSPAKYKLWARGGTIPGTKECANFTFARRNPHDSCMWHPSALTQVRTYDAKVFFGLKEAPDPSDNMVNPSDEKIIHHGAHALSNQARQMDANGLAFLKAVDDARAAFDKWLLSDPEANYRAGPPLPPPHATGIPHGEVATCWSLKDLFDSLVWPETPLEGYTRLYTHSVWFKELRNLTAWGSEPVDHHFEWNLEGFYGRRPPSPPSPPASPPPPEVLGGDGRIPGSYYGPDGMYDAAGGIIGKARAV